MVLDYINTTDGCISHIFPSCPVHKEWVLPLHASCWQVRRARRRDESSALGQQRPGIGSGVGLASLFHVTSSARRDWPQYPSTLYSLTVLPGVPASPRLGGPAPARNSRMQHLFLGQSSRDGQCHFLFLRLYSTSWTSIFGHFLVTISLKNNLHTSEPTLVSIQCVLRAG